MPAQIAADPSVRKIVVVYPKDVQPEQRALVRVAEELNRSIGTAVGLRFEVWAWETDAYPGFHVSGPQGLLDPLMNITESDIVIGIFWKRFGTAGVDGLTGTEHELDLAHKAWQRTKIRPQVMVYFNKKPYAPTSTEETRQWGAVLKYQEEFPKEGLWWSYKGRSDFENTVRSHLTKILMGTYHPPSAAASGSF